MGMPAARERAFELWLDLRTAEVTFAQQALVQLFYAVRRVVDEAGRALPKGAKVEGLLFDEARYDRADAIGSDIPIFLQTATGDIVNATLRDGAEIVPVILHAPIASADLSAAQVDLAKANESAGVIAMAAEPMLWAQALTGLDESELECLEANEGA